MAPCMIAAMLLQTVHVHVVPWLYIWGWLSHKDAIDAVTAADYKVSLRSVPGDNLDAYEEQLHACHQRSADKLLNLCFDNGGIYVKLGQHIGQLVRCMQQ
eukprot:GHRR01023445.1.p2 GENE.GHRR01023445.1~~GHRR01023445.1.p2  ORF type:complete len:100 (+),score=28.56 GHRR01023445.1:899-1198(+)